MFYEFRIKLIPITQNMQVILDDANSRNHADEVIADKLFCSNVIVVDKPLTIRERNEYVNRFIDDIIIDNSNVEVVKVRSMHLCSDDERVERCDYFVTIKLGAEAFIPSRSKVKEVDKINRTKVKMLAKEAVEDVRNSCKEWLISSINK